MAEAKEAPDSAGAEAPANATGLEGRRAVVAITDLMIGSKVRETLKQLGMEATFAGSSASVDAALLAPADLLLVDVSDPRLEPLEIIRKAKERKVPTLACGSHVDAATLEAGRQAGADRVVPRSLFAAQLPELIRGLLRPRGGA